MISSKIPYITHVTIDFMRIIASALLLAFTFISAAGSASAQDVKSVDISVQSTDAEAVDTTNIAPISVGLVLSGGGAKGIAHIGVIQALEDNDIPIDYITGTSMGSIVGGLYAAGYTPQEMLDLILSPGFSSWSTGQIDKSLTYYFTKSDPRPAMLTVPLGKRSQNKSLLPSSLINPLPMNFAFMELFSAYTAQCGGNFDNLFVPFRCVTSNVYAKHKIVCRGGSLGDAIRASMSFPVVFQPIEMDGVLVYDGGIYDNFPVDVMREDFAPGIMIGVDVSTPDGKPKPNDVLQQLEDMIIQNNDYSLPPRQGIKIKIDLQEFSLLDFPKAKEIYQIGYDHAMAMMDSIRTRVPSRIPPEARALRRAVFKSGTPYVHFDKVTVTGGTPAQNEYLKYLFTEAKNDTFGLAHAKLAYYRAISSGKLRNFEPQATFNDTTGLFALNLKASVKSNLSAGFGGYITSAANSMVFLSADYNSLSFRSVDANFNGWIGQNYMAAALIGRLFLPTPIPSALSIEGVISRQRFHESEKLFFQDNSPAFITNSEIFGRLNYGWSLGRNGMMQVGAGYGYLLDRFVSNRISADLIVDERDRMSYRLGTARLRMEFNTLDNNQFPSAGHRYKLLFSAYAGQYNYLPGGGMEADRVANHGYRWLQADINVAKYFNIHKHFALGVEVNGLISTRKLLPTYNASIVSAPGFNPTPSSYNSFNASFHAMSYATAGLVPVVKIAENLQARGAFHVFLPAQAIEPMAGTSMAEKGRWFRNPHFFGELSAVYNFPFASLTAYLNYTDSPSNWNGGLSFGLFFLAPRFTH